MALPLLASTSTVAPAVPAPRAGRDDRCSVQVAPEEPATMSWTTEGAVLSLVLTGVVDASLHERIDLLCRTGVRFERTTVDLERVTFFGVAGLNLLARLVSISVSVVLLGVPEPSPIRRAVRAVNLDLVVAYAGVAYGRSAA